MPLYVVCVCVCVCVYVCLGVHVCVCVPLCISMCLSASVCMPLYITLRLLEKNAILTQNGTSFSPICQFTFNETKMLFHTRIVVYCVSFPFLGVWEAAQIFGYHHKA